MVEWEVYLFGAEDDSPEDFDYVESLDDAFAWIKERTEDGPLVKVELWEVK